MSFFGKNSSSSAHFKLFVCYHLYDLHIFSPIPQTAFSFCCFFCCAEGLLLFVLAVPCGLWDLCPQPRDQTWVPGSDSAESQLLDCQGIPCAEVFPFNLISLLILAFVVCVFGVIHIQKSLPRPLSKSFFPMFSSRNFTVSGLSL